ncbi:MAG: ParB/RepB/Spo0J family partition protein, partial [bacterium]
MKHIGVEEISITAIVTGDRLRKLDQDWVAGLAESIRKFGLRQPIEVTPTGHQGAEGFDEFSLVSGAHRLAACQALEMKTVRASIIEATDLEVRLLEIDENLIRRELSPLDRAVFLARRKDVYEALHPETRHGARGGRESKQPQNVENDTMSFSISTAEKMGLSARTIERAVRIANKLLPDIREQIATTWLADSQSELLALTRLSPDTQRDVVSRLLAVSDAPPNVRAALDIIEGRAAAAPAPHEAELQRLMNAWARASQRARTGFIDWLRRDGQLQEDASG